LVKKSLHIIIFKYKYLSTGNVLKYALKYFGTQVLGFTVIIRFFVIITMQFKEPKTFPVSAALMQAYLA